MVHIPVLLQEVVKVLDPKPGEFFIDGTLGAGGHARAIIERIGNNGIFFGLDRDYRTVDDFRQSLRKNSVKAHVILAEGNYADLPEILPAHQLSRADGLLLDLGFSSDQIDQTEGRGRGFSFRRDEELLMSYDRDGIPAKEVIRSLSEDELAHIIKEFGEERYAKEIAHSIKKRGEVKPIETTKQLSEAILESVPDNYERGRIHPATRTFMALRIYVNQELDHLKTVLDRLSKIIKPGGRVAIISFHSLEDRIVKQHFKKHMVKSLINTRSRELPVRLAETAVKRMLPTGQTNTSQNGSSHKEETKYLRIITKRPIKASTKEISRNPRSRSAKLRAAQVV